MIQNNSLVVSLNIGAWTAKKYDKKVTDETNKAHGASVDAGRYTKRLADKKHIEPFTKVASEVKAYHYKHTIPWGDNGERLLASSLFDEYLQKVLSFKAKYEGLVPELANNIDDIKAEAKRELNGMYNEADYPTEAQLKGKFYFKVTYLPVPENDFRVGLSDEETKFLSAGMEREFNQRLQDATADIWKRIKDQLDAMKERLTTTTKDKDGNEQPAVFRDSLFGNLKELIEILPHLNITQDPAISDACAHLAILMAEPEAVRTNPSLRAEKAEKVEDVLNKFNSFFN